MIAGTSLGGEIDYEAESLPGLGISLQLFSFQTMMKRGNPIATKILDTFREKVWSKV
jgi:hypothetical protein